MSAESIVTAYEVAVPTRQTQDLPGLDKYIIPEGLRWEWQACPFPTEHKSVREASSFDRLKEIFALITGGDSGIGRATGLLFAKEGLKGVTISHLPQEKEDAIASADAISKTGCEVMTIALDLQHDSQCKTLVESHMQKFGTLNILVNNAAFSIERHVENIDLDKVRSTFESNILQMIAVTKFAVPHMKRGSSIINTTSVVAYAGSAKLLDYSSTKGAITSFTRSLAKQLAPRRIRVNAVAPGPVVTALQPASREEDDMEGFGRGMPMHGRAAQPAELAPSFVFLASPDANVMSGGALIATDGMHVGGS